MTRLVTTPGELARRGFVDARAAAAQLELLAERNRHRTDRPELPGAGEVGGRRWLEVFERAADPDLAMAGIVRIDQESPSAFRVLGEDMAALTRLVAVLGGSEALNRHLCAHPEDIAVLVEDPRRWTGDEIRADLLDCLDAEGDPADALRRANRRHLVRIAGRDLTSVEPEAEVDCIAAELADLADGIVETALAIARAMVPGSEKVRLGIVAMGKCGAQELNYISDVDVIFVAEPADEQTSGARAVEIATRIAAKLSQICSAHSAAGSIWQLDANLRPDGKSGPLVRTLASMETYYEKWAKNWEFQAMLKARPMAGDLELAEAFCAIVAPRVWQAAERANFLADTQAMRKRVINLIPPGQAEREIKLGPGGLRDTEFSVQLLQLVHGRADERLHTRATLTSLEALIQAGYIGRTDGAQLQQAYRFQRTLEHRVQLHRLRRTHLLPDDQETLRVLARGLGLRGGGEELVEMWRASARKVQRLHQRVFYSPLLAAVTRIATDELRLTPEQARDRLTVLGFHDPAAALRHMEALTTGVSRSAEIQRQLMPAMLAWFAEGASPDHALLSFRTLSEALGTSPWYLRALRDEGRMAERVARILSSSRYAVDLLQRAPETVRLLASDEDLRPRSFAEIRATMASVMKRHDQAQAAVASIRGVRRAELFRIVAADILDVVEPEVLATGLSELAGATIDAALAIAARSMDEPPTLGVVAMGRWGGREMGLGSDCDAIFVMRDSEDPDALKKAGQLISQVRQMLAARGPDPALEIDADLRPEGRNGPMVRSLSSCATYYQRWSLTWEAQALLRASYGAGDRATVDDFLALVAPLRWPQKGLERSRASEIRKLKARMETERIPRGTDPKRNTKLGPGGLSDVEWTVQLLQLQHAHHLESLRTTSTLEALEAATRAGLLTAEQARTMAEAWRLASRLRNKIMLVRGRSSDVIPTDSREVDAIATLLGYQRGQASMLLDDWLRTARHAVQVVDEIFWGK